MKGKSYPGPNIMTFVPAENWFVFKRRFMTIFDCDKNLRFNTYGGVPLELTDSMTLGSVAKVMESGTKAKQ